MQRYLNKEHFASSSLILSPPTYSIQTKLWSYTPPYVCMNEKFLWMLLTDSVDIPHCLYCNESKKWIQKSSHWYIIKLLNPFIRVFFSRIISPKSCLSFPLYAYNTYVNKDTNFPTYWINYPQIDYAYK